MRKYTFLRLSRNWLGIVENNSIHTLRQLEYMANAPLPLSWMIQRLAGVLIRVLNLIGKTSIFSKFSQLYCVAPNESRDKKATEKKLHRTPQWKNYDFTMFLSRITASHGIAVDWYLRVYWLLPFSIVDSFAEHRRFFCRAPWILGLKIGSVENQWGLYWIILAQ